MSSTNPSRPVDSGRRDSIGRKVMVSAQGSIGRADAPPPPTTCDAFDADSLIARGQQTEGWTPPDFRDVSTHTPWGRAQGACTYAPGIISYSCAGHGGFKLSPTRNAQVHEALRNDDGWYEEDCEWAVAAVTFPEAFPQSHVEMAVSSLRNWNPDGWTAATGEAVTLEQSTVLRTRAFDEAHANDQLGVSAIGGWSNQYGFDRAGNAAINDALDEFIDEHRASREPFDPDRVAADIVNVGLAAGVRSSHVQNSYPHHEVLAALMAETTTNDYGEHVINPSPDLPVMRRVPEGMVKVTTRTGGRYDNGPSRSVLVHEDEYRTRGEHPFVIDPAKHQEIAHL